MTEPAVTFVRARSKGILRLHGYGMPAGRSSGFEALWVVGPLPPLPKSWVSDAPRPRRDAPSEDRLARHTSELFDASSMTSLPRLRADSPRDLLQRVRSDAEGKDRQSTRQQVRQLRERIKVLEHEVASLRHEKPGLDSAESVIVHGIEIPKALPKLIEAITTSRFVLDLEDDWDDDGAAGFDEQSWRRAAETLANLATGLACGHDVSSMTMEILPGTSGGLDIDARLDSREVLISIPADPKTQARFYGDDGQGGDQIKATFSAPKAPNRLLAWMTS